MGVLPEVSETCWKKHRRTCQYGEHFYESLQPYA